jgi:hypothetical protein
MAKPNYNFEKRQREIAKKKKQEEKRRRKLEKAPEPSGDAGTDGRPTGPE